MTQNIITAGNATSNLSTAAGDDGTFKIVVGPNGSQVDALAFSAAGVPSFAAGGLKLATAIATTSGTSHDFTGIPSWVKRITVMLNEVSLSGTSQLLVQIGDTGGIENIGYVSRSGRVNNSGVATSTTSTAGFVLCIDAAAASLTSGHIVLENISGNAWIATVNGGCSGNAVAFFGGGSKTLSDILTQLRLTTVNGTDTFDAGSVNILYEG